MLREFSDKSKTNWTNVAFSVPRYEEMKNPYYTFLSPDNYYATGDDIDPQLLSESLKCYRSEGVTPGPIRQQHQQPRKRIKIRTSGGGNSGGNYKRY